MESLSITVGSEITIKSIHGKPIGPCSISDTERPLVPKPTQQMSKNYPPVPRNQVDRVNATIGHLLVFKVPLVSTKSFLNSLYVYKFIHIIFSIGYIL